AILSGDTPVPLGGEADTKTMIAVHVMPLAAFDSATSFDVQSLVTKTLIGPLCWHEYQGYTPSINFDGVLTTSSIKDEGSPNYAQIFRNGCIETVDALYLPWVDGKQFIPSAYERHVEEAVRDYMQLLKELAVEPPIFVALSLLGVR